MASDTRDTLVAVAAQLLDEGGPEAVTLREVGHRAGVSHNAPYKHFADKEALLAAVAAFEREEHKLSPARIAEHARSFDVSVFRKRFAETIDRIMERGQEPPAQREPFQPQIARS